MKVEETLQAIFGQNKPLDVAILLHEGVFGG